MFERAVQLYQMLGDVRGERESLFWVGIVHQVVRHDNDVAVPVLERSYDLAAQVGDNRTSAHAWSSAKSDAWAWASEARASRQMSPMHGAGQTPGAAASG